MLLRPKNTKYKKAHKGRISYNIKTNQEWKNSGINHNYQYGIIALEPFRITASNIYAIDLAIKRKLKSDDGSNSLYNIGHEIRLFPQIPVTKKPIETRMGKGKGNIEYWMSRVKRGSILVEFNSSNLNLSKKISDIVNSKLPIKTRFIDRSSISRHVE